MSTETMTPISLTLRQAREDAGLTQVQLAEKAGVRQATVSDMELGKSRRVDLDILERLANALDVNAATLILHERPTKRGKGR